MDVSVVIPAHNREKTIEECVKSVINQTEKAREILVVDDCSSDNTVSVLRNMKRDYPEVDIRIIKLRHNHGAQFARNVGIQRAKGEWIAFLDSDDIWLPNKLELQKKASEEHPDYDVFWGDYYTLQNGKKEYVRCARRGRKGDYHKAIAEQAGVVFCVILARRKALYDIGLLDIHVPAYQEWDTSLRLSVNHKFGYISEPLFVYVLHDGETISKNKKRAIDGYKYIAMSNADIFYEALGKQAIISYYENLRVRYENNDNHVKKYYCLFMKKIMEQLLRFEILEKMIMATHKLVWEIEIYNWRRKK